MSENEKNRITVEIYGQPYIIVGPESSEHIRMVAAMVDEKMRGIGKRNPSLDTSKLAVLTAVNAVHEYIKMKDKVEQLEKEIQDRKVD
ncbi:cell division protein ZapA [Caldibacillus lycopersici]|uniref:Cell division protein ZapA n=1 Tax=Perspicuibacillus lycopersici TaxID=1325689 RepID=A0AAE3IVI6_9BACI|nr:cell division protein ZapA [Perspicuibacillus lycopersici]MCU9614149.1 cell division protein ZapA [Perspicuibacillus lycopersici]